MPILPLLSPPRKRSHSCTSRKEEGSGSSTAKTKLTVSTACFHSQTWSAPEIHTVQHWLPARYLERGSFSFPVEWFNSWREQWRTEQNNHSVGTVRVKLGPDILCVLSLFASCRGANGTASATLNKRNVFLFIKIMLSAPLTLVDRKAGQLHPLQHYPMVGC